MIGRDDLADPIQGEPLGYGAAGTPRDFVLMHAYANRSDVGMQMLMAPRLNRIYYRNYLAGLSQNSKLGGEWETVASTTWIKNHVLVKTKTFTKSDLIDKKLKIDVPTGYDDITVLTILDGDGYAVLPDQIKYGAADATIYLTSIFENDDDSTWKIKYLLNVI
jgi:hypothetical protein